MSFSSDQSSLFKNSRFWTKCEKWWNERYATVRNFKFLHHKDWRKFYLFLPFLWLFDDSTQKRDPNDTRDTNKGTLNLPLPRLAIPQLLILHITIQYFYSYFENSENVYAIKIFAYLILRDLNADMEKLTISLLISVISSGNFVLASEARFRYGIRRKIGRSHLSWG